MYRSRRINRLPSLYINSLDKPGDFEWQPVNKQKDKR